MEITSRFQNLNWSNLNTTSAVCWDLQEVNTSHFSVNQLVRQAGRQAVNWSVSQSVSLCLLVSQSVCLFFGLSQVSDGQSVKQAGSHSVSEAASHSVSMSGCLCVGQSASRDKSGLFSWGGAPPWNDVTDGWRKEILKANNEEEGLWQVSKIMWTADNT